MLRLIYILFIIFNFSLPSFALEKIEYKNIDNTSKIKLDSISWVSKVNEKKDNYFIKQFKNDATSFSEYYYKDGSLAFITTTQYEFIHKGSLIGYSNDDLKFYEIFFQDGYFEQRELIYDEVRELFPDFKVLKISDFSTKTNCLKIKKKTNNLKLILLNDTENVYDNYQFTTDNAIYKEYSLKGFINISKEGMIHFARSGDDAKNYPWYILLVR